MKSQPTHKKQNSLNPAGIQNKDGIREHEPDYSLEKLESLDQETKEQIIELNKLLQHYTVTGQYMKGFMVMKKLEQLEKKHGLTLDQGE